MQERIEEVSEIQKRVIGVVAAEQLEAAVNEKIDALMEKGIHLEARPDSLPEREIRRRFSGKITREVSKELALQSLEAIVEEKSLKYVGEPKAERIEFDNSGNLNYVFKLEVMPEVRLPDFAELKVEKFISEVTASDVDAMVETLREQSGTFAVTKRASRIGDRLTIAYIATVDGVFEVDQEEEFELVLGASTMMPAVESQLAGLKNGDKKEIEVVLKNEYGLEFEGKTAVFKVQVNSVAGRKKARLSDAFFKQFDVLEGGLEAFLREIKSSMEMELKAAVAIKEKIEVLNCLADQSDLALPASMVEKERRNMGKKAAGDAASEELAERRLRQKLLVDAFVKENKLEPDESRVRQLVEEAASGYEESEKVAQQLLEDGVQLARFRRQALEEMVVEQILAKAKVIDKQISFREAVSPE